MEPGEERKRVRFMRIALGLVFEVLLLSPGGFPTLCCPFVLTLSFKNSMDISAAHTAALILSSLLNSGLLTAPPFLWLSTPPLLTLLFCLFSILLVLASASSSSSTSNTATKNAYIADRSWGGEGGDAAMG